MLKFNIQRLFTLRGISNPYQKLVKLGISRPTAWNLLNNDVKSISSKHLEKICEYLNCQPNDLYEWKPDPGTQNVDAHPLRGLRRDDSAESLSDMLREVPIDRVTEIKKLIAGLQNSD